MNIIAIIAAKGNSTGVPRKNMCVFNEVPLVVHTIRDALQASTISPVLLSTEDAEIQQMAISNGAVAPFLRPVYLTDNKYIPEIVWSHALLTYEARTNYSADWVVGLNPCYAHREAGLIDRVIDTVLNDDNWDTIGGAIVAEQTVQDMWTETPDGATINLCNDIEFKARQYRQPLYLVIEGLVTLMRADIVREGRRLTQDDNVKIVTPADPRSAMDIDTGFDLWLAQKASSWNIDPSDTFSLHQRVEE